MSVVTWRDLVLGMAVTIVKLAPGGAEAARYPGEIVAALSPDSWVVARATYTYPRVDMDGLSFIPGDELLEWFSPTLPFNAFAVFSPAGDFRGWYANVTKPAYLLPAKENGAPPLLVWHDMYVDLVGLPSGKYAIRDLDELHASSLVDDDQALFESVLEATNELRQRFTGDVLPFVALTQLAIMLSASMNSSPGG